MRQHRRLTTSEFIVVCARTFHTSAVQFEARAPLVRSSSAHLELSIETICICSSVFFVCFSMLCWCMKGGFHGDALHMCAEADSFLHSEAFVRLLFDTSKCIHLRCLLINRLCAWTTAAFDLCSFGFGHFKLHENWWKVLQLLSADCPHRKRAHSTPAAAHRKIDEIRKWKLWNCDVDVDVGNQTEMGEVFVPLRHQRLLMRLRDGQAKSIDERPLTFIWRCFSVFTRRQKS